MITKDDLKIAFQVTAEDIARANELRESYSNLMGDNTDKCPTAFAIRRVLKQDDVSVGYTTVSVVWPDNEYVGYKFLNSTRSTEHITTWDRTKVMKEWKGTLVRGN